LLRISLNGLVYLGYWHVPSEAGKKKKKTQAVCCWYCSLMYAARCNTRPNPALRTRPSGRRRGRLAPDQFERVGLPRVLARPFGGGLGPSSRSRATSRSVRGTRCMCWEVRKRLYESRFGPEGGTLARRGRLAPDQFERVGLPRVLARPFGGGLGPPRSQGGMSKRDSESMDGQGAKERDEDPSLGS
jgi:hypothetical protein